MTEALHWESPAKVNLRLEILKKREDGYHELQTILQKISLYDKLHFSLKKEKGVFITTNLPNLPVDKRNLVYQAVRCIFKKSSYQAGIGVKIEKKIPLGAGLGGGSSNAATTLVALNQLLKLNLPGKELLEIGLEIGADVPFFLFKGAAIGSGIGERLKKIELPSLWYVLIYPNFEVSTRWAYQNFVLTRSTVLKHRSKSTLSMPQHLCWGVEGLTKTRFHINLAKLLKTPREISRILWNDLEKVVSERYCEIDAMKKILHSAGALGALMTGSGPTVFGFFPGEVSASEAYKKVREMVRPQGWTVLKAHSIP